MSAVRSKKPTPKKDLEHKEQAALFTWASSQERIYPCLSLMHAIPNGGQRHIRVAVKLKAEGVRAGVLDVDLPVPSRSHIGLRIEMKYGKNTLSEKQEEWAEALEAVGHKVVTCWNWVDAKDEILKYLADCRPEILSVRRDTA